MTFAEQRVPSVPAWLDDTRRHYWRRFGRTFANGPKNHWVLAYDQAIIRRMVLKRCIYGVDKNRLTVGSAKVSLWLHSFTVGAPLSFLDHHLRSLAAGDTEAVVAV